MEGDPAMRTDVNGSVPVRKTSRSLMLTKLALGTALTLSLAGFAGVSPTAAQDDQIVLGGNGGSTLTVSPGHASAESAVASAEAGPGWAVTEAAAARAMAHADCGAMTEGAAASAVAIPDIGAAVDAAIAEAKATAEETAAGIDVDSGGQAEIDAEELKAEFEECFEKERKVEPPKEEVVYEEPVYEEEVVVVEEVPSTGAGAAQAGLAGLMGAAAAAAAFGAVALRRREDVATVRAR